MSEGRIGRPLFETTRHSPMVTFDDGKVRRNLPYHEYDELVWSYAEPDSITIRMVQWIVVLRGHNLELLFNALAEQTLKAVRVRPECAEDRNQQAHSFVTEIAFLPAQLATAAKPNKPKILQGELSLNPSGWGA